MAEPLVALSHALPDLNTRFSRSRIGYSRRVPASGRYFAGPRGVNKQKQLSSKALIVSFIANYFLPETPAGEDGQNYQLAIAHVHALTGEPGKNDLWSPIRNPLPGPLLLAEAVNCPKSGKRVEAE